MLGKLSITTSNACSLDPFEMLIALVNYHFKDTTTGI
jgi:hypothetical protein